MSSSPETKRKREESITDQPEKERKGSFAITMPIDKKLGDGQDLMSPAHSFDGLTWYLHVACRTSRRRMLKLFLFCKEDGSSELWRTKANIQTSFLQLKNGLIPTVSDEDISHTFCSWDAACNNYELKAVHTPTINPITSITITIETESDSFTRRPRPDPKWSILDAFLVLEGQKFPVNKQELSVQSSYFDRLFNGDFKESKQDEIEIKDTVPEDFSELLQMVRRLSTEPTTVDNAIRYLIMADMFDIQIVKDRMENFLLSTDLVSIHRKFLIAEQFNLAILKESGLLQYKNTENLRDLSRSSEYAEFPPQLVKDLLFHSSNSNVF